MNKEDFIKLGEDTLHCDECAFCEDCEDRFTQCVANYQHKGKPVHLKSCEYLQWNTMSEESKAFFLQECLPHEYKRESSHRKNEENKLTLWKRIVKKILFPFVFCWFGLCWCIMKIGRGIYWFGNRLSGDRLDPYNWTQEI